MASGMLSRVAHSEGSQPLHCEDTSGGRPLGDAPTLATLAVSVCSEPSHASVTEATAEGPLQGDRYPEPARPPGSHSLLLTHRDGHRRC